MLKKQRRGKCGQSRLHEWKGVMVDVIRDRAVKGRFLVNRDRDLSEIRSQWSFEQRSNRDVSRVCVQNGIEWKSKASQ